MTYTRQTTRYVQVMLSLTKSPKTTTQIAQDLGMSFHQALADMLRQMHKLHMIHISGWAKTTQEHAIQAAIWHIGEDFDAEEPISKNGKSLSNLKPRMIIASPDLIAFREIWNALEMGKKSSEDLSQASGFTVDTVNRLVKLLHSAQLIYIAKYDRQAHGGDPIRRFTLGYKHADVERPLPLSKKVMNEKRRILRKMEKFSKPQQMMA